MKILFARLDAFRRADDGACLDRLTEMSANRSASRPKSESKCWPATPANLFRTLFAILKTPVLATAILGGALAARSEGASAQAAFAWPEPGVVKVTEIRAKRRGAAKMTYDVHFRRLDERHFVATQKNLSVLQVNGVKVTPEMAAALGPLKDAAKMPPLKVDAAGFLVDVLDLDSQFDLAEEIADALDGDDRRVETIKKLRNEQGRAWMKQLYSGYWTTWVEGWIEFPARPGEVHREDSEFSLPGGAASIPSRLVYQNLGPVDGRPALTWLKIESTIKGAELGGPVKDWIASLGLNGKAPDAGPVGAFAVRTMIEAKIDLETLKPSWARSAKYVHREGDKGEGDEATLVDSAEFTFRWPD